MDESHPTWVRGLKQSTAARLTCHFVAPHVGAWIETIASILLFRDSESHPTWVRGLKPLLLLLLLVVFVAPHVGAWIETR